jgi:hypothetical protein
LAPIGRLGSRYREIILAQARRVSRMPLRHPIDGR